MSFVFRGSTPASKGSAPSRTLQICTIISIRRVAAGTGRDRENIPQSTWFWRNEERISSAERGYYRRYRHQNGRIVQTSHDPVEALDMTGYSVQSDSKLVRSLQSYEVQRVRKRKRKVNTVSVVSHGSPKRFQLRLHRNFRSATSFHGRRPFGTIRSSWW